MQDSKNNIMFRKTRAYNGRNDSSIDSDFSQEQARYDQQRQRRQETEEQRRVMLFGSSEEKAAHQSKVKQDANLQLMMREQQEKERRERQRREDQRVEEHRQMMDDMHNQRERERREKMRQMQEENRMAIMAKNSESLYRKVNQDRQDKDSINSNISNYQPNVF
mmetsp:Transcript_23675/g.23430  ORF Transcript_23675/g.23430 Transcript_23675/m.23430 type:complete len:164 (+) Transcript_23675:39-530(+)